MTVDNSDKKFGYEGRCQLCGRPIPDNAKNGLCFYCNRDYEKDQDEQAEENRQTSREISGFSDEDGYHPYDDD